MSDDTDERDEPESGDRGAEDRPRGFRLEAGLRPLSSLLGTLIEVNASETPPPDDPVDWTTVDENYPNQRRSGDEAGRTRTIRVPKTGPDDSLVDARSDDDEFVVTADVPGATKDDLSVGIDPGTNELVIGRDGTVLERVPLPWQSPEPTTVWFNNGVLEVRVRPADP